MAWARTLGRDGWLLFATVPFWIERVGLYQYLGVEILIFAIYALAFNLVADNTNAKRHVAAVAIDIDLSRHFGERRPRGGFEKLQRFWKNLRNMETADARIIHLDNIRRRAVGD